MNRMGSWNEENRSRACELGPSRGLAVGDRDVLIVIIPGTAEDMLGGLTGPRPSVGQLLGVDQFAARLAVPEDRPEHALRLGMSCSDTRITEEAGAMEVLARVLFWLRMQFNYL